MRERIASPHGSGMWSRVKESAGGATGRLAGRSAYLFGCRIVGAITVYATQVVLARQLGKEALGRYVSSFSVLLVLAEVALVGLASAALRFVGGARVGEGAQPSEEPGERALLRGYLAVGRRTVLATSVVLSGLAALVVGLSLPADAPSRGVLLAALVGVPAMAWLRLHGSVALARSWLSLHALPISVARPVLFLGALGLLFALRPGTSVTDAMLLHVAVIAAVALVASARVGRRIGALAGDVEPRFETRLWVATGFPLLFVSLATAYLPDVAVIALRAVLPAGDVGVFAVTFRTAFFLALAGIAVDGASLPRFARHHADGDRAGLQREVVRATRVKFAAALAGLVSLALLGRPVLGLFGEGFAEGYPSLLILGVAFALPAALGPGAGLLGITGHERTSRRAALANLAVVPALIALLAPSLGIQGAAYAVLAANLALSLWLRREVVRRLGIEPSIVGGARP